MDTNSDLRQHKKSYPDMVAFADIDTPDEDVSKSRDERVLEFELEKTINKIQETINVRQEMYSLPEPNNVLSLFSDVGSVLDHRKDRDDIIKEASAIPKPPPVQNLAEVLIKSVALSAESRNTHPFVVNTLCEFYANRQKSHPLRRYKLLFRWARHCSGSDISSSADVLLHTKLKNLSDDCQYTESALIRLKHAKKALQATREHAQKQPQEQQSQQQQQQAGPRRQQLNQQDGKSTEPSAEVDKVRLTDFWIWLNHTCYASRSRRRFSRFATKCKWLVVQKRWELFTPISDHITSTPIKTPIPLMALTDEEMEPVLEELTTCFRLRGVNDDSQEYSYSVNKRFAAVFSAQTQASQYSPYELSVHKKNSEGKRKTTAEHAASGIESGEGTFEDPDETLQKVYLAYSTWEKFEQKKTPLPAHLEAVYMKLNNNQDHVDGALKVEADFLLETDAQYVVKRLREQAGTHVERATVRAKPDSDKHSSKKQPEKSRVPQSLSSHKKQALYLLRFVRIREFRKRLLDIVNYFTSIRRRLCLDRYGYVSHTKVRAGLGGEADEEDEEDGVNDDAECDGGVSDFTAKLHQFNIDGLQSEEDAFLGANRTEINSMCSIECRDDTYRVTGKSITVIDRFGQAIVYDLALRDLETLEHELLKIGTHYIGLYKVAEGQDVDRVTILEDLYECETWFQDGKRKVIDCYMEAYEHSTDPEELTRLSQLILETISMRPMLDLNDTYFTAAYSNETIVYELIYSLIREIINTQITEEKRSISSIYKASNTMDWWSHAGLPQMSTSDTKLYNALFPGSSVVNILDFYSSLGVIADVMELVNYITMNVMNDFGAGMGILSAVKQQALQLMFVEWKVLTEEERVQRQLQSAAINEDTDDRSFLDDAEAVHGVINSLLEENVPTNKKGEVKKDEALQRSLWYDTMEAVILRSSLLDALYETELLYNIHRKQGCLMGIDVKKFQFEAMDFETRKTYAEIDDHTDDIDMAEVIALRTEYLTQLAIAEFEHGMAHFDFHSAAGLKRILSHSIPDLRRSLNVQMAQKNILVAATLYNQLPIDMYYQSLAYEKVKQQGSTFVTQNDNEFHQSGVTNSKMSKAADFIQKASKEDDQKDERGLDAFPQWLVDSFITQEQLRPLFLSINYIKSSHRRQILEELNARTAEILRSRRPELLRKKMKELKHNLIHEYCLSITASVMPFALRWQAARQSHDIKKHIHEIPGIDKVLRVGLAKDNLDTVASTSNQGKTKGTQWNGSCLMALDGRIEEPWYIPHFMQIYTQWNWEKEKQAGVKCSDGHTTTDLSSNLRTTYCLQYATTHLYHMYCIVLICTTVSKLDSAANITASVSVGMSDAVRELKKVQADLEALSDPSDTRAVSSFMEVTYKVLFLKLVLAVTVLKHSFLSPPGGAKPMKNTAAIVAAALVQLETASKQTTLVTAEARMDPHIMTKSVLLRLSDEQFASDYRTVYRRLQLLEYEWERDEPKQIPAHKLAHFDEGFFDRVGNTSLWIGAYSPPLHFLNAFLLGLGDEDRKALLQEYNNISNFVGDVKNDQSFVEDVMIGSGNDRERDQTLGTVKASAEALEISIEREMLKTFYCWKLEPKENGAAVMHDRHAVQYNDNFVKVINSKARAQYEHDLQEDGGDTKDTRGRVRRKKRTEIGLRKKQTVILKQEINKHLLHSSVIKLKGICETVNASVVQVMNPDECKPDSTAKLEMFNNFHTAVMTKAAHTRQEGTDFVVYQIPAPLLSMAMDNLGINLRKWQVQHLKDIAETSELIIQHHRHALFKGEQKVLHLEKLRELDKKALSRRVAARVNDEKYNLIFHKNCLQKENDELRDELAQLEAIVREKVKAEYEEDMTGLRNEIALLQGQFKDHKKKLYREMQINLEEIKRHAMMSIGKSEVAPLHMKRQALRIAINDEETNKLKEHNAELQMTVAKLKLWHEMKISNLESHYQKKIAALEKDKADASSKFWGNKEQVEEKEELMRQQLNSTQKSLSATEMEVEQLLRDLDLQERKKKHLVAWKVCHSKQLEELTKKTRRYEKYEKYDIEKLLRNYEKGEEKPRNTPQSSTPAPTTNKAGMHEMTKEIDRLREDVKKEKRLKTRAFVKLNQMREEQDAVTDEMVWQKKYFECASELQRTLKDLQVYKEHLSNLNITHPTLPRMGPDTASPMSEDSRNLPNLSSQRDPLPPRVASAPGNRPPARVIPTRPSTSTPTRLHSAFHR